MRIHRANLGAASPFSSNVKVATTAAPTSYYTGADTNAVPTLTTVNASVDGSGNIIPGSQWVTSGNPTIKLATGGTITLPTANPMPNLSPTQTQIQQMAALPPIDATQQVPVTGTGTSTGSGTGAPAGSTSTGDLSDTTMLLIAAAVLGAFFLIGGKS